MCAGVAVVFGDLVGADRSDLVLVVLAERLLDENGSVVADGLPDDVVFDGCEDVLLTEDDRARGELLFVRVDALRLGDLLVGGVDKLLAVDRVGRIRQFNEVARLESVLFVAG